MPFTLFRSFKPLLAFYDFTYMWMFNSIFLFLFGKLFWMTLHLMSLELRGRYAAPPHTPLIAYVAFNTPLPRVHTTDMIFNTILGTFPRTSIPSTIHLFLQVNFINMLVSGWSPSEPFHAEVTREDFKKKNRKFSELGLICLSTYLPPLNCDDVNSDNWPEISWPTHPAVIVTKRGNFLFRKIPDIWILKLKSISSPF